MLAKKGVEVFLRQCQVPSKIHHQEKLIRVIDIIDNQYVIYITDYFPNSTFDEQYFFYQKKLNNWHYSTNDWAKTDDTQFIDINGFDDSELVSFILLDDAWHSMRENTFWQPKKKGSNFQGQELDMANHNDLETKLSESLKEPLETTSSSKKAYVDLIKLELLKRFI